MGRAASHITLECALQTHPNITIIGEEVNWSFFSLWFYWNSHIASSNSVQGKSKEFKGWE